MPSLTSPSGEPERLLVFVLLVLLVLFFIRVWWDGFARFLNRLGRVSRVKFHALVLSANSGPAATWS